MRLVVRSPALVGVKVRVRVCELPADIVKEPELAENCVRPELMPVTESVADPVLLIVSVAVPELPTVTSPKDTTLEDKLMLGDVGVGC